jgi:hypothetical protein
MKDREIFRGYEFHRVDEDKFTCADLRVEILRMDTRDNRPWIVSRQGHGLMLDARGGTRRFKSAFNAAREAVRAFATEKRRWTRSPGGFKS